MFQISRSAASLLLALLLLVSCSREGPSAETGSAEEVVTNRLAVPPEVVSNLGITFAQATRGKIGSWIAVPGELYVPKTHRWNLRAPAQGRLTMVLPHWKRVGKGEVVAELLSPKLQELQQELLAAHSRRAHAKEQAESARARLGESEEHLQAAKDLERKSRERLEQLRRLDPGGKALAAKELLESQRLSAEASRSALEAAIRRDDLREAARQKDLLRAQAQLHVDQRMSALSLLAGRTLEELSEKRQGDELWKTLESIVVRAPAGGTVVEVPVSQGETVEEWKSLALILDSSALRFRGWLPEGDLQSLRSGAPVQVELPGDLDRVHTELLGPMPVADSTTRRVLLEAEIPNPDRVLPQGLSATAHVQLEESASEEVLLPGDCVVNDGLEVIVFRRDPQDPGFVIRTSVELGLRGAGLVEVLAGVLAGDTVVQKGLYQLKQTGLGKAPQGGHFHADGSWHGKHE